MTSLGSTACNKTVERLIKRTARKIYKIGDIPPAKELLTANFPATKSSMPKYYQLERFAHREEYHARLQTFISADAISVEWDPSAGERGQLTRITLASPIAAADLLGIDLPWEIALSAIDSLRAVAKEYLPPIEHIINAWKHGKAPSGVTADKSNQFIDSMRVIDAAHRMKGHEKDLLLRRLSANLFGTTKRIEALARQIAFLLNEPDNAEDEHVFARLGLVKYPQPMLLSGAPTYKIKSGEQIIPLVHPYIGLRPDMIVGLENVNEPIKRVLTIENLASFNEAAESTSNPKDLLLIYVAGNPTPSLRNAYSRLLKSAKPSTVMHWGDIDVGGFRIAAQLAKKALNTGHKLQLWHMNPAESALDIKDYTSERNIEQITTVCKKYGWIHELNGVKEHPVFQEQELINWEPPC